MTEPALVWIAGVLAGIVAVLVAAVATRVQLLPDVIDLSIVPTVAGAGGIGVPVFYAALLIGILIGWPASSAGTSANSTTF
jgi:hypothetical protein